VSSEARMVRPYLGVDRIQHLLTGTSVQFGSERLENGASWITTPDKFLSAPLAIVFARDEKSLEEFRSSLLTGLQESGVDTADVEMLVICATSRLKIAEVCWRLPLDALADLPAYVDVSSVGRRPKALTTPFGGCQIDLYVCLSRDRKAEPLRPWRKGTWLGHVSYSVSTSLEETVFNLLALNDDKRAELGLPKGTLRYISVDDPTDPTIKEDGLTFWLDEELLARLALTPTSHGAKSLQRQLFLDAMAAIVREALRSTELRHKSVADIEDSLLGKLIDLVAGPRGGQTEDSYAKRKADVFEQIFDDPGKFTASIENWIPDLKKDLSGSLTIGNS
jgi:hypothetical protein